MSRGLGFAMQYQPPHTKSVIPRAKREGPLRRQERSLASAQTLPRAPAQPPKPTAGNTANTGNWPKILHKRFLQATAQRKKRLAEIAEKASYASTPKPARWIALVMAARSAPSGRRISPLLRSTEIGAVPAPVAARVTASAQPAPTMPVTLRMRS